MRRTLARLLPLLLLAALAAHPQSSAYLLALGYQLPSAPDLRADASAKLASCLNQRVVAVAACRAGDAACRSSSEIAFRTCLAGVGVPGAGFDLALCRKGVAHTCLPILPETADQAVDSDWTPAVHQLPANAPAGWYTYTGLAWLPDSPCAFQRVSDGAPASFAGQDLVCEALHDARDTHGAPVLLVAIGRHQDDLIRYLLNHPAGSAFSGGHPMRLAATQGDDLDLIRRLFREKNYGSQAVDYLAQDAVASGHLQAVAFFLGKGADPNAALQEAARDRDERMTAYLLRHGARATSVNVARWLDPGIPVAAAPMVYVGYQPPPRPYPRGSLAGVAELLFHHGGNPNQTYCGVGTWHAGVSFPCGTALTFAIDLGRDHLAQALIASGAGVNDGLSGVHNRPWDGRLLPLVHAVVTRNAALVELLLEKGARIENSKGEGIQKLDPERAAVLVPDPAVLSALMAHGARPLDLAELASNYNPGARNQFSPSQLQTGERERARECAAHEGYTAAWCSAMRSYLLDGPAARQP